MSLKNIVDFILETPLYEKVPISLEDNKELYCLVLFNEKIDCYCPQCNKQSTFKGINNRAHEYELAEKMNPGFIRNWDNTIQTVRFSCTRNEQHMLQLYIYILPDEILKVGQYPSFADISLPDMRKYREVLSKEKYKEFNRSIGLVTHGVGVGAFVYLRRIFEDLIEDARKKALIDLGLDESVYWQSRMDEKIRLLKSYLPAFLVENKKLYSILSKGIHELTEIECLQYFPTVKLGIELILDEKIEEKARQDKIEHAKRTIEKLYKDLSSDQLES